MNVELGLEKCFSFINCQLESDGKLSTRRQTREHRAITISRQTGCGAHEIAEKLSDYLQATNTNERCPWTVFDRNLVEKVLEDHKLPQGLRKFMPEDRTTEISDIMDELFGLHPPSWTLVAQASNTILHLAQIGNVILIGRGANVVTARLDHVLHVRLVGSLEKRLAYVQEKQKLNRKAALKYIQTEDTGRRRYLRKYFDKDVDDPLLYHITLNTDGLSFDAAAQLIARAASGDESEYREIGI